MSNIHEFAIEKGKLLIEKKKEDSVQAGSPVHEKLWELLLDYKLAKLEWTLAFNVIGPFVALKLYEANPAHSQKIIDNYLKTIGPKADEASYFNALKDPVSKIAHILRERFELMLRVAKDTDTKELALEMSGLTEVKTFVNEVPRYLISAVYENLSLVRNGGSADV